MHIVFIFCRLSPAVLIVYTRSRTSEQIRNFLQLQLIENKSFPLLRLHHGNVYNLSPLLLKALLSTAFIFALCPAVLSMFPREKAKNLPIAIIDQTLKQTLLISRLSIMNHALVSLVPPRCRLM